MGNSSDEPVGAEKRRHERKNLSYQDIPGEFHIVTKYDRIPFNQVNDVSISGMGVLLHYDLDAHTDVHVTYTSDEYSIDLEAKIAWKEILADDVFRYGIEFEIINMDDNVMFFMTLREYIDDFGASF